jgi:phosphoglycolate phosphatase
VTGSSAAGSASPAGRALVVGFDLDMTLIDSRQGIAEVYRMLADETGVPIDADLAASRLGPPLETELAEWFPAADVPAMAARYREIYRSDAIPRTPYLPGAPEAVDAVHALGGRVIVITSKFTGNAHAHVDHLGLRADEVVGSAHGEGKRDALLRFGAGWYVGDHVADMRSARAADAIEPELGLVAVGVTTGPCDATELMAAGADIVLPDLWGFPAVLRERESGWSRPDGPVRSTHA